MICLYHTFYMIIDIIVCNVLGTLAENGKDHMYGKIKGKIEK